MFYSFQTLIPPAFAAFLSFRINAGISFANLPAIMAKKTDIIDAVFVIAIWLLAAGLVMLVIFKSKLFH